jgi:Abscisic acid G-protein coupled receptor
VQALSQYVTIVFVGFISFNSLRAFLKHVRRAAGSLEALLGGVSLGGSVTGGGRFSSNGGSVTGAERAMLGLGALLCAYTVSSVMLLRAQLPVEHRGLVTRALGFDAAAVDSEFDAVHRCAPRARAARVLLLPVALMGTRDRSLPACCASAR